MDVVLLDISMPLLNGMDAARQIRKISPKTKLIFLTMHADRDYVIEALRIGASGYLLKWSAETELGAAIDTVLQGAYTLLPRYPGKQRNCFRPASLNCEDIRRIERTGNGGASTRRSGKIRERNRRCPAPLGRKLSNFISTE